MYVREAIRKRRSIRKFKGDTVPDVLIMQLLESARLAPLGLNVQPWKFIVVKNAETKRKLQAASYGQPHVGNAPVILACCANVEAFGGISQRVEELIAAGTFPEESREICANIFYLIIHEIIRFVAMRFFHAMMFLKIFQHLSCKGVFMKIPNPAIHQIHVFLLILFSPFFASLILASEQSEQPVRKAAIFIDNRAGGAFNDKVSVLEDFITSRITEQGFRVLSREVLIDAFKTYSVEKSKISVTNVPDQQLSDAMYALKMMQTIREMFFGTFKGIPAEQPKVSPPEVPPASLEQQLSSSSSVLRLAQMMGADYIIAASITSFGTEEKAFEGYGIKTVNRIHTLRISYKILDAVQGGSLVADIARVSKTMRSTEGSRTESSDMINEMLDDASVKISESLMKKRIIEPPPKPDHVEITIACGMQDLAQLPVNIPDIRVTEDGTVVIGKNVFEMQLLDVTVELNGTVIGSAPGTFKAPPGLNKIRLSREGFRDWERTINIFAGQKLKVSLQMSDAGYARWKDNTAFLQKLKNGEKLTDASVKAIEGVAQMLRQSGFKVDVKGDINLDIKADKKPGLFSILSLLR